MLKLNYKLSVHFLSDFPTFMRLNFLPHRKSDMWLHFLPHGRKSCHMEGFPTTYQDFLPYTWISYHLPVFPTTYPSWPWCSCEWVWVRWELELLDGCTQERDGRGPPSDMDTSVVSGRSTASRHSVARLGGSLVHSSSTTGVRDFFNPGSILENTANYSRN